MGKRQSCETRGQFVTVGAFLSGSEWLAAEAVTGFDPRPTGVTASASHQLFDL